MTAAVALIQPSRLAVATQKEWLTRKEASRYLEKIGCPISVRSLEKRAQNNNEGKGPPFTRVGWKTVRYARADLDAWASKEAVRIA